MNEFKQTSSLIKPALSPVLVETPNVIANTLFELSSSGKGRAEGKEAYAKMKIVGPPPYKKAKCMVSGTKKDGTSIENYEYNTPTHAAQDILGHYASGGNEWLEIGTGKPLKNFDDYRKKDLAELFINFGNDIEKNNEEDNDSSSVHGMTSIQASSKKLDGHIEEEEVRSTLEKVHKSYCYIIPSRGKVDIIEILPDKTYRSISHKGDVTTIQFGMHMASTLKEMFGEDSPIVYLATAWAESNYARQAEDTKCVSWLMESPENINTMFTKIMTNSGEVTHFSLRRNNQIYILDAAKVISWLSKYTKVTNSPEAIRLYIVDPVNDSPDARVQYYGVIEPRHDKDGTLKFGTPKREPRALIIDLLIEKSDSVIETVNIS